MKTIPAKWSKKKKKDKYQLSDGEAALTTCMICRKLNELFSNQDQLSSNDV